MSYFNDHTHNRTEQLSRIDELANIGPLFKSSDKPVELTESETEYVVRCIKHTFPNHLVFQVCHMTLFEIM